MPHTPHIERHFTASEAVRDIVIGMSDGLTVPFALAAGLSSALAATKIIVTAGLAEIAAGSIAMGLGGYLAAKSDAQHYDSERMREQAEIREKPIEEAREIEAIFRSYGLSADESRLLVETLRKQPDRWIDFMMRFELGLEAPDGKRAFKSALTIALAYIAGGLIPLSPYMLVHQVKTALALSAIFTFVALLIFGYAKGHFAGAFPLRSALQTALVGGAAATAAFLIARAIS
jgi:VIT1/CCC1 family predicted Fe2+/Mn2+ transporter